MPFYDQLAVDRNDSVELRKCIENTVTELERSETSVSKPGILLGKIQSGKTRAFLGVIGLAFDKGYDIAVILTKGTKSLAKQTIKRVREDFKTFLKSDAVQVFDIMKPSGSGLDIGCYPINAIAINLLTQKIRIEDEEKKKQFQMQH